MNTLTPFKPEEKFTSVENLAKFIAMCRNDLTVFGSKLPFDQNVWDLSEFIEQKAMTKRITATFSTYEYAKANKNGSKATHEDITAMQEPFLSFAKAYFRYRFGLKPVKNTGQLLEPLRVLEQALVNTKGHADPTEIDNYVLDEAVKITKDSYGDGRAYRIGGMLEKIGKFLSDKRLTKIQPDWKNPIKRPSDTSRIGKEADDRRNKKMPSKAGLEAIPEIFNKAHTPYEQLASALIALLICAPNRVNEIFLLPYDCEVMQKDKDGKEQYGLRWEPAKGAPPMIKWIIPSMVDIAKESIRRLKHVTQQAREVARWYEKNPNKLYLPEKLEYLRGQTRLTTKDVAYILYGSDYTDNHLVRARQTASTWIKRHSMPHQKDGHKVLVNFVDLEKELLSLLPEKFPYLNKETELKYSNALILQMINEYHSQKGTLLPTISPIRSAIVNDALRKRGNLTTLFDRFGYTEKDGSPIKITSHQFRHYLNTLAQKGGLSQIDIAKWSGRIDIHQNQAYDHISVNEMLEIVQKSIGNEKAMIGPLSNIEDIKKKVVITRDEFARLLIRTAHPTEYGICFHDYSMLPCQLHRDCMNCTEHICMKGDTERTNRIKQLREDTRMLLERAKEAHEDGHFGSNRWIEHHTRSLEILDNTCTILDNPQVPNGSLIQLSNLPIGSPLENAINRRSENTNVESINHEEIKNILDNMGGIQ